MLPTTLGELEPGKVYEFPAGSYPADQFEPVEDESVQVRGLPQPAGVERIGQPENPRLAE
ncbi:MAG: hypothetical protein ACE5JS_19620 [Nitrospinota bacterium]